jgi:hypothetical protein
MIVAGRPKMEKKINWTCVDDIDKHVRAWDGSKWLIAGTSSR